MADKINDLAGRFGKSPKGLGLGMKLLATTGAAIYGLAQSMFTVEGGQRAVMFNRIGGTQKDIYGEGLHFRLPWFQYPVIYDIRAKPRKITSPTGSKDLQTVNISLRVLSRPLPGSLPIVHQTLGYDYEEKVLPSIVNEILKSVVAKFNAAQLITMRQQVSQMIRQELSERAKDFHLVLDDVSITDLSFGQEYTAAVESKQVAQQEAQRATFIVEQARQERQQRIVYAEGEAEAATKVGEAIGTNSGYLKLRKITAAKNIGRAIAASQNKVYLGADTLMLNINSSDFDERLDRVSKRR